MPRNDKKVIAMISQQVNSIEERCEGYRSEIMDTIADILEFEREHQIKQSNIQQKINDKCDAAANFLVDRRGLNAEGKDK